MPDHRDKYYDEIRKKPARLPRRVDLRPLCSAVKYQRHLQSCTSHAISAALEFLEKKDHVHFEDLSRLFIYYNERLLTKKTNIDSGARLRDGIKSLREYGVCPEKLWPYVISRFRQKPPPRCYREARKHRITSYHRIMAVDEMKVCLAEGYPFVCGISVYQSFLSRKVAHTGHIDLPKKHDRVIGGHAVLVVGYDESAKSFLLRNSAGHDWGQGGYFTVPYKYLENRRYSWDFWTIRRVENL